MEKLHQELQQLGKSIKGDIFTSYKWRIMYATDASAYREVPLAVCRPKDKEDIKKMIRFAAENKISLIPRTAGTSLAGQVVGNGIVVDVSKHMNDIIEINAEEKWVRVQAGVVLDELNKELQQYHLFFAPETSTANRCMIGGMLGNNACGAHSLVYGSTRDHVLEIDTILSDGSEAIFKALTKDDFEKKMNLQNLEGKIYKEIHTILSEKEIQEEIQSQYPDKEIKRRNTGYALDLLYDTAIYQDSENDFNMCKLLAGSEGTLAFTTEIKLNLVPLPPKEKALLCVHCNSIAESLKANLIALKSNPVSIELMDKKVLDLSKKNPTQNKNRFFIQGDPAAILIVEFAEETKEIILQKAKKLEEKVQALSYGYHFPLIFGNDITKVWNLRKAGLGVLSNMPGDAKPVPVIEDTAVNPEKLPDYIADFNKILEKHALECVYYAHIATGELHLRPILNLKDPKDVVLFHTIALETAKLVKKYKGSLSGEHGDGRLRGEFIPLMFGEKLYETFKKIKAIWDPNTIFNPNKIVDTPKMNSSLRYSPGQKTKEIETIFDFSADQGILRAVEKCNGSGDCRKSHVVGGTMCPSYMATKDEDKVTRARANVLRDFLTHSNKKNPFDHKDIYEIMDLCLSCKACKSECPSGIDVAKLKAEFLQHYYDVHGISLRTRAIANLPRIHKLASPIPRIFNFFIKKRFFSSIIKTILRFERKRSIPLLQQKSLNKWMKKHIEELQKEKKGKRIYLFNDEFTNFLDSHIGITAIRLLNALGYEVLIPKHDLCARTYLSKGLIRKAKKIANNSIRLLKDLISDESPLIGIEPSAILGFRDEYPDLVDNELKASAKALAKNALLIDEFLADEMEKGNITKEQFMDIPKRILYHGHCQQKAVASTECTKKMLSFPSGFEVEEIPSGCCGMAGAFGYEKEHYELSMKIGELVLFPAVRNAPKEVIIAASGTSCRHQIKDGTGVKAFHPIELLYGALKEN
jgi:FAD/FMN-containing dehydrogenase/Fe-S oxidoreductase